MKLLEYVSDMGRRQKLAAATGNSPDYLWQIAAGIRTRRGEVRRASPELAKRIEEATDGVVSKAELRPDLWGEEARPSRAKRKKAA